MRKQQKIWLMCLLWGVGFMSLKAQTVIASAGDTYKSPQLSISWTLGEGVVNTLDNNNLVLTQGFHQSKIEATSLTSLTDSKVLCNVYPNPSSDFLIVEFKSPITENVKFSLFDAQGLEVLQSELKDIKNFISLSTIPNGNYLLKISSSNVTNGLFSIIKTN